MSTGSQRSAAKGCARPSRPDGLNHCRNASACTPSATMRTSSEDSTIPTAKPEAALRSANNWAPTQPSAAPAMPVPAMNTPNSSAPGSPGRHEQQTRRGGHAGKSRGHQEHAQMRPDQDGHAQAAGQQEVPATGLLLAAGDPGRGQRPPHADQHRHHGAGAPHREPARVVEGDGRPEERADGRVLRQRLQRGRGEGSAERAAVLGRDERGHRPAQDADHDRAAPDQPHRDADDQPGRRARGGSGRLLGPPCGGPRRHAGSP